MSLVISTLLDAVISKVLPRFGVPEIQATAKQLKDDSYDSLIKSTRVEPFCIMDSTLTDLPYTETLLHVSLNILIAYYLQAVSLLNYGNGIPPVTMLRRLSPEGHLYRMSEERHAASRSTFYSGSLTNEQLSNHEKYLSIVNKRLSMTAEASFTSGGQYSGGDRYGDHSVMEVKKSNLIVGKTLTIEFNPGETSGKTIPINVNVRYDITESPPPLLVKHLAQGSPDSAFSTRLRKLRAGKIKFWSEFVFATDLLDEQRRLMLMDKNNLLSNIIKRRGSATISAATGGGRNFGISSNCLIISTTTLKQAEAILKGDISNERVRNSIFKTLSLLTLVVVDKEYERFTFYFRNKPMGTTVSAKVLKSGMGGDKEDNLEALAKALSGNQPVTF